MTDHIELARGMCEAVGDPPGSFVDLGSGGGVPGLPLALAWPEARAVLIDSRRRACAFLLTAVGALGLGDRVAVECGRAEALAHESRLRGVFDLVVARSFGPPAVTAECAVGFLRPGGRLAVSEPPSEEPGRWPSGGLGALGLRRHRDTGGSRVFVRTGPPGEWPRRSPQKAPLW